jgi:urease accessory protein
MWGGLAIGAAAMLVPLAAQAHTGIGGASGFAYGFVHPVNGLDHILAMVAVGAWAAQVGGRALWLVPCAFVGTMILGGVLGMMGVGLPMVELGIVGSIILLGGLIALRTRLPLVASMALVGLFALFHGHAHGAEVPVGSSAALYAAGFAMATGLLHGAGIALVAGATRLSRRRVFDWSVRAAGGGVAAAGLGLLIAG